MRGLANVFFSIAVGGFVASALIHLLALAGIPPPGGMAAMGLHIGIFIVWIPALMLAGRGGQEKNIPKRNPFSGPPWTLWTIGALFIYAFVNFFFGFRSAGGPETMFRLFSGHWMLFYFIAATLLHSYIEKSRPVKLCPNRHEVSPSARYCQRCEIPVDGPISSG